MILTGTIIGITSVQTYAAGRMQNNYTNKEQVYKQSSTNKILDEINHKKDVYDFYKNIRDYSEKDAKHKTDIHMVNEKLNIHNPDNDFINSLKVKTNPHDIVKIMLKKKLNLM